MQLMNTNTKNATNGKKNGGGGGGEYVSWCLEPSQPYWVITGKGGRGGGGDTNEHKTPP